MEEVKDYTREEAMSAMKYDNYLCQIIRTIKSVVPDATILTDGCFDIGMYNVFLLNVPVDTCIEIAKMIDTSYDIRIAGEDTEYPLYIDSLPENNGLFDITELI